MMGLRTLALTYVVGGLTFLPVLLVATLAVAWYLLPTSDDAKEHGRKNDASRQASQERGQQAKEKRERHESVGETAASGTFAVLRQYDFAAAVGALNARNNNNNNQASAGGGAGAAGGGGDGAAGDGLPPAGESVYQSMYRSVFAGSKNASASSLLDADDVQHASPGRRKPVPAHIMYIVLRHGHLMLYDSPAQVEVKHVISLAHHKVTLQAGKHGADEVDERQILESDLYVRRTAIVLTPVELPHGALQQSSALKPPKPFYLFAASTIEKEDFYHALLSSRDQPPIPRPIESDALIKLQSALHSSALTPETRALNALLGRIFLGVHRTDVLVDLVRGKIEKKLARIQKPTFIPVLQIRSLDLGDAGPILSNLKMRDLNISGDMTLSADVRYSGALSITLLAVAKLDLGQRFKTRTIDLVLKATLQRIQGHMLLRVKPPPSNRIWFTFETMPDLEIRVEPVVSERKITYGFVLRAIEERVRTAFAEGLVKPNWDDVPMPLQDTRGSHARGGIWSDEGEEDHAELRRSDSVRMVDRSSRTMSTPDLVSEQDTGISSGISSNSDAHLTKLRHSSTMPINNGRSLARPPGAGQPSSVEPESKSASTPRPPKPLRSSSITSPSPIVAMDEQTVEPVRADDESLRPAAQKKLWRTRGSLPPGQSQKGALDELRDLRDRAEQQSARPSTLATDDGEDAPRRLEQSAGGDILGADLESPRHDPHSEEPDFSTSNSPRTFSLRSTNSTRSTAPSTDSSASLPRSQQLQQKKTTILAAAGAATNAARTWGWNTYQKNKTAYQQRQARQSQSNIVPNEPMGRGQPLPPPGMPLPGPQKGIWPGVGSMRRKPVGAPPLPTRRPGSSDSADSKRSTHKVTEESSGVRDGEDEFGIWQENPGAAASAAPTSGAVPNIAATEDSHSEELLDLSVDPDSSHKQQQEYERDQEKAKKAPPPLPTRPHERSNGRQPDFDGNLEESSTSTSAEDISEAPGLRVPESEARAIAAENSTAELALGASDDKQHIDEAHGVEADIHADAESDALEQSSSNTTVHPEDQGLGTTPERTNSAAEERFLRGEDVTEDDFEQDDHSASRGETTEAQEAESASREPLESDGAGKNDVAERIKAQVQKHSAPSISAAQKSWHGGPQGSALERKDR